MLPTSMSVALQESWAARPVGWARSFWIDRDRGVSRDCTARRAVTPSTAAAGAGDRTGSRQAAVPAVRRAAARPPLPQTAGHPMGEAPQQARRRHGGVEGAEPLLGGCPRVYRGAG